MLPPKETEESSGQSTSLLITSPSLSTDIEEISDFGPIDIVDYKEFLNKSKAVFIEKWNSPFKQETASLTDFKKHSLIGAGSFGKVFLVRNNLTNKFHAMKAISKETIIKCKQLEHSRTEKLVLQSNNCPFMLRLQYFFIDNSYIYLIVPFAQGGELFCHLKRVHKFDEITSMFFVAQVILALEYLHFVNIVFRDIKPENILIDHTGYVKLADFGFCKHLTKGRTYTMCGTPEYLAPEVISGKGYGKSVDWWAVGVLAYELSNGFTPFKDGTPIKVYNKIFKGTYKMPASFSLDLQDLLRNILQADISKRYGNLKNGVNDIKEHRWFRPLNWQAVSCRKFNSPYIPTCLRPDDTQYFRPLPFSSLIISSQDKYYEQFEGF